MHRGRFMAQYGSSNVLHKLIDEKNGDALLVAMEGYHTKRTAPNPNLTKEHFQRIATEFDPKLTDNSNDSYLVSVAQSKLKKMHD